jgi:hypothetical protein
VGIACLAVFASLGMGLKDIRKKSGKSETDVVMDEICEDDKKSEEP